jgi:hypothetical protein
VVGRNAKGVESLVQASAAEAEAMSAALAAAEARAAAAARESTGEAGEKYSSDRDRGSDATSSGKPPASPSSAALIALNRASISGSLNHTPPTGVRLHHRVVCSSNLLCNELSNCFCMNASSIVWVIC